MHPLPHKCHIGNSASGVISSDQSHMRIENLYVSLCKAWVMTVIPKVRVIDSRPTELWHPLTPDICKCIDIYAAACAAVHLWVSSCTPRRWSHTYWLTGKLLNWLKRVNRVCVKYTETSFLYHANTYMRVGPFPSEFASRGITYVWAT